MRLPDASFFVRFRHAKDERCKKNRLQLADGLRESHFSRDKFAAAFGGCFESHDPFWANYF
jgi:hypothetical protein